MLYESRLLAQKRWRLLARALTGSPGPEPEQGREREERQSEDADERPQPAISTRRFSSFGLLRADRLPEFRLGQERHCSWWLYSCLIDGQLCRLLVRRVSNCFTADQLIGFNNTGNVCVWPSEECLAYYILKNRDICRRRRVLELGGGMSCLAGALAAKYCEASSVTLTDGNARSVENVSRIVESNGLEGLARCFVVQWARAAEVLNQPPSHRRHRRLQEFGDGDGTGSSGGSGGGGGGGGDDFASPYDVILCADCLFFDEARLDLVDTIYGWLADGGLALVMAPRRGATFRRFAEAAARRGLVLRRQSERYDPEIWARHLQLLASDARYCPDIHFPVLLELTKADYWKSQARKYCDFCKCWISDNKASVDFHEGGKKHKENVSKRLKEIHKNSAKQAKQQRKFENDLEQMEKAAMEAYMKDVANNTRDMTADSIIQQKWSREQAAPEPSNPNQIPEASAHAHPRSTEAITFRSYGPADIDPLDPYAKQKLARLEAKEKAKTKTELRKEKKKKKESANSPQEASGSQLLQRKVWYEARSQGYSYYWNIETNETMWEPPAEGFMSLAEQAEEAKEQALQEELFEQIDKEGEQEKAAVLEEQRANAEREKLKEIRKRFHESKNPDTEQDDKSEEETVPYRRDYSVPEKPQPYGSWQVVNRPKIDFQLPKKVEVPVIAPSVNIEEPPPRREFKEKTITSISTGDSDDECSGISFKKRKFGNRNVRKRIEND